MDDAPEVQNLIEGYEEGIYTRLEIVSRLIKMAARIPAETLLTNLPTGFQIELSACVAEPYDSEERVYIDFSRGWFDDDDSYRKYIAEQRAISRRGYENLYHFFQSRLP